MLLNPESQLAISRFSFNDALVLEGTVERFMSNLQEFMQADPAEAEAREQAIRTQIEQTYYGAACGPNGPSKPFIFQDGIAVIPVHGVLINRFNYSWGFVTGYNYIRAMLRAALADDDVELIAFDVDSPGGDAPGCFELCEEIRASREGGWIRIEVADRGPGIHPNDLTRIFEKFGRGRDEQGRKVSGVGLGLYLSRRIVRSHGSELRVRTQPGAGSVFGFDLEVVR